MPATTKSNEMIHLVRVLKQYTRAVVHLRNQFETKRMGLVFGAGLSRFFRLPNWKGLVDRIAKDPHVHGEQILKAYSHSGLPYQTELLFQHFRRVEKEKAKRRDRDDRALEYDIRKNWREILLKRLYEGTKGKWTKKDLEQHPYLPLFIDIIRQLRVTVTYNFDDVIEQALHVMRPEESSRGYVSITNGARQLLGRGPIVYHPNGFIPSSTLMEAPSDRLIFSEHSYADDLVDHFSGDRSRLLNYLTDHTCLFVGMSLTDQGVRNLLRQCAKANPGGYHYLVSYVDSVAKKKPSAKNRAVTETNFDVYNLVTLFLTDQEIAALARLIAMPEQDFCDLAEANGIEIKYCFYLIGALGVGKSTAISSLGSLNTFDEWMEPRPPLLAKAWTKLSPQERLRADKWITRQFQLKNDSVRRRKCGIYVLDRAPLDPLAFTKRNRWPKRARELLAAICPPKSTWQVEPGCIFLLTGDHDEMSLRMRLTSRVDYDANALGRMHGDLETAYSRRLYKILSTKGLSPAAVVARIAKRIFLDDYKPVSLHDRLRYLSEQP
jgi:hypothetical protein